MRVPGRCLEVNCETDFVAKDASFRAFADAVAAAILAQPPTDITAAGDLKLADGKSVEATRQELIARIGENISLRRFAVLSDDGNGVISAYLHGTRIGVLVALAGSDDAALGRDIAMHIAASRPLCIGEDDMPADDLARERKVFLAQAAKRAESRRKSPKKWSADG